MSDPVRIEELEDALRDVIAYLRVLLVRPATSQQAAAAEAVLVRTHSTVLQAGLRCAYGGLTISAQLNGTALVLKTEPQRLERDVQLQLENGLQARLVRGISLSLKPPAGQFSPGFFTTDAHQKNISG